MQEVVRWAGRCLALCIGVALSGCGGGGGGGSASDGLPPTTPAAADYTPMAVGDTWVFRRGDGGLDQSRVTGTRVIDGQSTLTLVDTDAQTGAQQDSTSVRKTGSALSDVPDGSDALASAVGPVDSVRLPLRVGDSYTTLDRTINSGFDVDGDNRADPISLRVEVQVLAAETVTVEAGSFEGSLRVRSVFSQSAQASTTGQTQRTTVTADEWYAPGIGVVRRRIETNTDGSTTVETQDLVSYRVGSHSNDTQAPSITSTSPSAGTALANGSTLQVNFNEPLDPVALAEGSITVLNAQGQVVGTGSGSVSGTRLTARLPSGLASGQYAVRLGGNLADLLGNRVAASAVDVTIDATGPTLLSTTPAANASGVALDASIELRFSEAIAPDQLAIELGRKGSVEIVPYALLAVDPQTLRLTPSHGFANDSDYEVRIASSLSDALGNAIGQSQVIPFHTTQGLFLPRALVNGFIHASAMAAGDVTGDGRADLLFVSPGGALQFARQTADGRLADPVTVAIGPFPAVDSIQIADLNGDGRLDVVFSQRGIGLQILLQDGSGQLVQGPFLPSADSLIVRVADLNGDGLNDLVATGATTNTVSVWRQQAGSVWSSAQVTALAHMGTVGLAVGDLNGDGRPDIAVSSYGSGPPGKGVGLLYQQADGSFLAGGYLDVDPVWGAQGLAIGDINGDGRADIVTGHSSASVGLAIFLQRSDGSLASAKTMAGFAAAQFRIADVNGDGRADLLVLQNGLTPLSVLLQQPDGSLRTSQQVDNELWSIGGSDGPAVADLNGDGLVDVVLAGPTVMYAAPRTAASMAPLRGWRPHMR